ncbi:MAG: response regulator transcription factor [Bacteroidales bacterium]|nr:response regulator transcription factor [Bacteroidales bacterium]
MDNIKLLIIEDEQRLAAILKKQFEDACFQVDIASDGYAGRQMTESNDYNLIILDVNLPLINGFDLCREIRKSDLNVPIIMLTALGSSDNKLTGFTAGADDYVVKPFDFRELLARVNVFLRRSDVVVSNDKLSIADLELDLKTKTVTRSQKKIDLTAKEFLLLETFLKHKEQLLTRDYIIEQVWGIDFDPGTNVIDVYVNYLRKKVDKDFEPRLIHTKFGYGFYCSVKEL